MKTNFLCQSIPLKTNRLLLKCGIFIMLLLCSTLSVYAQLPSRGGGMTLDPVIFNNGTLNLNPCENPPPLGQQNSSHWLLNIDETSNPVINKVQPTNTYAASYSNTTGDMAKFFLGNSFYNYFHFQVILDSDNASLDAFFKFGLFGKKTYSVNNRKLFYATGHTELAPCDVINFYYNRVTGFYTLMKNSVTLECGSLQTSLFSIGETAFIKARNRPNVNSNVFVMFRHTNSIGIEICKQSCEPHFTRAAIPAVCPANTATCTVSSDNKVGIEEQGYLASYPNPANSKVTLLINPPMDETLTVNIIDAMGRVAQSHTTSVVGKIDNTLNLDTSQLLSGIYYITIDSEYRFEVQKITIIK